MTKTIVTALLLAAVAGTAHADDQLAAQRTLEDAQWALQQRPHVPPIAEDIASEGYVETSPWYYQDYGEQCAKTIDTYVAGGVAADAPIEIRGKAMTIAEGKEAYCGGLVAYGKALQVLLDAAVEDARRKVYEKYEKLGVKGDRLELFVYYDDTSWYMKGCQYTLDEPADIAKAKALFHWLDNSDGSITIRKYRFKKNTYKISEKTYWRSDKAYRGCR